MDPRSKVIQARSQDLRNKTFREFWTAAVECSELVKSLAPISRRSWLENVVQELYERQKGKCALTGNPIEPDFQVDHVIPHSYGGGNERANLRLVNRSANQSKGNRGVSPEELLKYLEDRYMNR
jgi:5-methylcytosine-specific restriction endonuclease McrA